MTTKIMICIFLFMFMIIGLALNKYPMGVTSCITIVLLVITGCLDNKTALASFGNSNFLIIVGMFVVGAAFASTSFMLKFQKFIGRITKGNFKLAYLGVLLIGVVLTSVLTSPLVAYSITFPIMNSVCDEFNISRSKVQFPLAVVCISCCAILPFGFAISEAAVFNGLMETYGFSQQFTPMDFTKGRLPMIFVILLWAYFLAMKYTPEKPIVAIEETTGKQMKANLKPWQDVVGCVIFVVTILALIFNAQLKVTAWIIVIASCMLSIICGVITEKDAIKAMPIDIGLMFIGANSMAGALISTGSAKMIGNMISQALGDNPNTLILCIVFFLVPFILTQFMQNQGVMNIFAPICLLTCKAIGADPTGLLVLICAGSLTAFMTPSATGTIPITMAAGGYDLKSLTKMSWVLSLILTIFYISYVYLTFKII